MKTKPADRRHGSNQPRPTDPRNFCVYFILCPELNRVKIGYTARNPNQRLEQIAALNPGTTIPLGIIARVAGLEKRLHARFKRHRLHHEWFRYDQEIEDFIKDFAESWPTSWDDNPTESQGFKLRQKIEEKQRRKTNGEKTVSVESKSDDGIKEVVQLAIEGHDSEIISHVTKHDIQEVKLIMCILRQEGKLPVTPIVPSF